MRLALRRSLAAVLLLSAGALAACDDDPTGPSNPPPTGLAVTANSATAATITFQPVSSATGYVIERAMGASGGEFQSVATVQTTTYQDTGLQPGTEYRYRVASIADGATGQFSTEQRVTTLAPGRAAATINSDITSNRRLYADTVYTLSGFVKVQPGAELFIEPGTRIEGDFNTVGSSLFVLRGARIRAMGTRENPIVFTSSRPEGQRQPGDWGGLILIGNGIINRASPVLLEGTENFPGGGINYAGGTDNADSSGELHFVRIEFAGYATQPNAELNSLTLAAVGSGTQIDHVQTIAGLDDSFEWFGGAVDAKYLVSYESGDDHFDASEGFAGRNQFLIAYQSRQLQTRPEAGSVSSDPQGIENDGCAGAGCTNGQLSQPFTIPMFANFTLVGTGEASSAGASGGYGMVLRRGAGGFYVNGIVARWPRAALSLRDATTEERSAANELLVSNLLLAQNGSVFAGGSFTLEEAVNNIVTVEAPVTSLFAQLPADPNSAADINWSLSANSAARTGGTGAFTGAVAAKAGTFVTGTAYRGAADPSATSGWWEGWTRYFDN